MKRFDPVELKPARAWRTYLGGAQIDRLHGARKPQDSHFPEEWIMSVVTARNAGREEIREEGLSYVKNEKGEPPVTLKELVASDPEHMLGLRHMKIYGASTGVLVKIIDSSERLTIQVHPDKAAARRLFGSEFGKTECWHILGTRKDMGNTPCIYMGFQEGVTRKQWEELFEKQDIGAMLGCLHRFEVKPGDTFIIHGGVPHAIGAGCMLIEIQEPTDYTIRTERVTPAGLQIVDEQCHQGLGFDKMFDCFHYDGCGKEEARKRWQIAERVLATNDEAVCSSVVDDAATTCFRMERYEVRGSAGLEAQDVFSGIYVISGEGELTCGDYIRQIKPGSQFFLPAACAPVRIRRTGKMPVKLFRFYGPKI